ncbi:response regulator transcription factor [Cetobacterium sp. 2G large]|uniref:response regulator transcription factor n=1 Tax=Cetobacterium sp. 2G large TaxID=2759680 RepID=UPI00163BD523|nr:response regulator transcription factor [Cetobacterium sp. 2G large]MBC2853536.1 response regulator transcription factor [Cetobacterium sp. 2G large]
MKILIIEDDDNKYKNISRVLLKYFPLESITLKKSYNSGLREILKIEYDLILLDMSLPIYENEKSNSLEIKPFTGIDILNQMKRYQKKIRTIVVTQFEIFSTSRGRGEEISITELRKKLEALESQNYKGLVYYDVTSDSWETELIDLIRGE